MIPPSLPQECLANRPLSGLMRGMTLHKLLETTRTFHLKELLSLGLKKGQITNLVQKAAVFKDIPRQQGYAIDYTFNQAVLLHVGGELSKLGISFRHINKILFELAGVDFEKKREKITRSRLVMFIFSTSLSKEEGGRLAAARERIRPRGPGAGKAVFPDNLARMAPLGLWLLGEGDARTLNDALGDYVRINLYKIVMNVAGL